MPAPPRPPHNAPRTVRRAWGSTRGGAPALDGHTVENGSCGLRVRRGLASAAALVFLPPPQARPPRGRPPPPARPSHSPAGGGRYTSLGWGAVWRWPQRRRLPAPPLSRRPHTAASAAACNNSLPSCACTVRLPALVRISAAAGALHEAAAGTEAKRAALPVEAEHHPPMGVDPPGGRRPGAAVGARAVGKAIAPPGAPVVLDHLGKSGVDALRRTAAHGRGDGHASGGARRRRRCHFGGCGVLWERRGRVGGGGRKGVGHHDGGDGLLRTAPRWPASLAPPPSCSGPVRRRLAPVSMARRCAGSATDGGVREVPFPFRSHGGLAPPPRDVLPPSRRKALAPVYFSSPFLGLLATVTTTAKKRRVEAGQPRNGMEGTHRQPPWQLTRGAQHRAWSSGAPRRAP